MILSMRKIMTVAGVTLLAFANVVPAAAQGFNAFKDPAPASSGSGMTSGPDLKASVQTIQGGRITSGATSYIVTLFKNNGTAPVRVTGINLYPSSNITAKVSLNKCGEGELPPEAECAVTIAVTALQVGAWRIEVLLDHSGKTRLATAVVTGDADGVAGRTDDQVKPDIEATPAKVDFGTATGGVPARRAVNLRNRTQDPVSIKGVRFDIADQAGFTMTPECPDVLQSGETCSISITWSPVIKGSTQGVIFVNHSGKSAMTQIDVAGTFQPATTSSATTYPESVPDRGLLIADKDQIDFGSDIKGAAAVTASLVNTGSTDLVIKAIRLSGSDNGLSIARIGCKPGMVLAPVEACPLTVNWVPSREGEIIDDLQIVHSGTRGILVLPIRGSAPEAVSRESFAMRGNAVSRMLDAPRSTSGPVELVIPPASNDGAVKKPASTVPPPKEGINDPSYASVPAIVSAIGNYEEDDSANVSLTPVLDGYKVTSHSLERAVINGPVGSIIVRDGQDVVVAGVRWTATIVTSGVILSNGQDEILLVFDRSLKPVRNNTTTNSSSSSSTSTNSTDSNTNSNSNSNSNNNTSNSNDRNR